MSFIIRASTRAAAVRRIATPAQARCFSVSSSQFLKETAEGLSPFHSSPSPTPSFPRHRHHSPTHQNLLYLTNTPTDSPNQGEAYERAKQEQLRLKKEGKNEWSPDLASASEENVHADRDYPDKDIKELQREAKERAEREAK
jgi:hypothetical protein